MNNKYRVYYKYKDPVSNKMIRDNYIASDWKSEEILITEFKRSVPTFKILKIEKL